MEGLDTDGQARRIQRDIDRTREEMDQTLSDLERRLAPSEILHQGARTLRDRVRNGVTSTVETLKRNPAQVALASAVVGAMLALRPSAADRRRHRAEADFERALGLFTEAAGRAKQQSRVGAAQLATVTWQMLQRASDQSRDLTRTFRREAGRNPLGALALVGLAAGVASLGRRGVRAWR